MRISSIWRSVVAAVVVAGSCTLSASAHDIAWVTFHSADNTPSTAAATAGFTQAPDVGYTNALTNAGHNVTRIIGSDTPDVAALNQYDVVIVSRSTNSGNFELDAETAAWNSIQAPMIVMSGYSIRNVRLGLTLGGNIPDTTGTVKLRAQNAAHPIFQGISLTGGVMNNDFANMALHPVSSAPQRGISVNTDPVAAFGRVIATVETSTGVNDGSLGGMMIGEWSPGVSLNTTANGGPQDILAGHRIVFLSGSREADGISLETAGVFDLTPTGQTMFLNTVNYAAGLGFTVPGDVSGNGTAGPEDYTIIRNNFQGTNKTRAQGDLTGDGIVNFADFRRWKNTQPLGSGAGLEALLGVPAPEPGSALLALAGAWAVVGLTGRRRQG